MLKTHRGRWTVEQSKQTKYKCMACGNVFVKGIKRFDGFSTFCPTCQARATILTFNTGDTTNYLNKFLYW